MERLPLRMLIAGLFCALVLCAVLVPRLQAGNSVDILTQVLGGTAGLVAQAAYEEADTYFHGGVSGGCPDEDDCSHEEHASSPRTPNLPLMGLLTRLDGETGPALHKHLRGDEEKELLPWFLAAVRLDPHHVEAWCTGSYWYYRTGQHGRAVEFITQGIQKNPDDYRIYLERGVLYHRLKQWDKCITDLEHAQRLWNNNSEDAPFHLKAIRVYMKDALGRAQRA